jgi:Rad52/22 family double-strand break repair protein
VVCKLHLRLGDEWITKMDVGGPSEQPDEGDRRKAAFSDALKRAAVKFGLGRYLYRLPSQWVDYDPKKRQFVNKPTVGPSAMVPKAPQEQNLAKTGPVTAAPPAKGPASAPMTASATKVEDRKRATGSMPTNGVELQKRLASYDAQLARQGICAEGTLVQHILDAGKEAGLGPDLTTWTGSAINLAVEETRHFETAMRQRGKKEVA